NDKPRAKSAARRLQDAVQAEADAASERGAPTESDNGPGDDGRAAKLAQLQGLAQELGLSIEGNTVTPIERAKFRERRRQTLDSLKQKENELAERERALSSSLEALRAANTALESGDFDALARALGRSNWNELNSDAIRHFQDPNFR